MKSYHHMKKKLGLSLLFVSLAGFFSCHNQGGEAPVRTGDSISSHAVYEEHVAADSSHAEEEGGNLSLNNGKKWKTDAGTEANVQKMKKAIADFSSRKEAALGDYRNFGKDFQALINDLLKNCRMTGPDHEALHKWLFPLMGETGKLSASGTLQAAEQHFKSLKAQLDIYDQYFEENGK